MRDFSKEIALKIFSAENFSSENLGKEIPGSAVENTEELMISVGGNYHLCTSKITIHPE